MADAIQVMRYFGYATSAAFAKDWKALSEAEKAWFKEEVGKEVNK